MTQRLYSKMFKTSEQKNIFRHPRENFSECYSSKIWRGIHYSTKDCILIVSKWCTAPYYNILTPPYYYIFIPRYHFIFIAFEMVHTSILHFWLDSLGLGHHLSTFVDHGYDHLEICKQVDQTFSCILTNVERKRIPSWWRLHSIYIPQIKRISFGSKKGLGLVREGFQSWVQIERIRNKLCTGSGPWHGCSWYHLVIM